MSRSFKTEELTDAADAPLIKERRAYFSEASPLIGDAAPRFV